MRIGLQSVGTYGDFVPFLALANGLADAGHEVTLVFTSADDHDYTNHPRTEKIRLIQVNDGSDRNKGVNLCELHPNAGSFQEVSALLGTFYEPFTEEMYAASDRLCKESELVIGHVLCHTLQTASIKHACPRVSLIMTPLVLRSDETSPFARNYGTWLNSLIWRTGDALATRLWYKTGKKIREREGVAPVKSLQKELIYSNILTLVGASEVLSPRPKDWPGTVHYTGFLNSDPVVADWSMPSDLQDFLSADEPPVYLTFGSCSQYDVQNTRGLLMEAARLSGKRCIVQCDWAGYAEPDEMNIYRITTAPHDQIFPHCSLIVHHGGAGTTQAAIHAGKPSIVVAHCFDQPYWAYQLHRMGVGGRPMLKRTVSAQSLGKEIKAVTENPLLVQNALAMSQRMKQENGVAKAVRLIGELENDLQ